MTCPSTVFSVAKTGRLGLQAINFQNWLTSASLPIHISFCHCYYVLCAKSPPNLNYLPQNPPSFHISSTTLDTLLTNNYSLF